MATNTDPVAVNGLTWENVGRFDDWVNKPP